MMIMNPCPLDQGPLMQHYSSPSRIDTIITVTRIKSNQRMKGKKVGNERIEETGLCWLVREE